MKQKPFTAAQAKALQANYRLSSETGGAPVTMPVVKFFCPWGAATWLFSEWDGQDTLFGLCDLGHGMPELGYASLSELRSLKGPWGLTIERDLHFSPSKSMIEYADEARVLGRISA